jgi:hypothetical protein
MATTIFICLGIVALGFFLSVNTNEPNNQIPPSLHLPMQPHLPDYLENSFKHIEAMYRYKKQVEREKIAAVTTVVVLFLFLLMLYVKS